MRGFTVFELLVVIALVALLSVAVVPSFATLLARNQAQAATQQVAHHLASARSLAIHTGRMVTFCGLDASDRCTREDVQTFAVFIDNNQDGAIDSTDPVKARFKVNYSGRIALRASNTRYILFRPNGSARTWGSVFFCPQSPNQTLIRRVTVSKPGRAFVAPASPATGVVPAADGGAIDCS